MDIRSMACFVAVAEELHFHRAAERLHLTQPALSQRIRVLEAEIGTPLFERNRRNVALTPAGAAFLEPARKILETAEVGKASALAAARGEAGRLRLGFTVIAFYGVLPQAVQAFRIKYPEVAIELVERNSPLLEDALAAGTIDLAVLHPPLVTPNLTTWSLPDEPMMLALPQAHPLAKQPVVRVRDLAGIPFLAPPRAIGPSIYDRMIALFHGEGVSLDVVQEVTPMTTLTGLVAAGAGLGFVTAGIARIARPGIVFRPVEPQAPSLPLAACWRGAKPSATAERFLEMVQSFAQPLSDER